MTQTSSTTSQRKRKIIFLTGLLGLLGTWFYAYDRWVHEETDNAYITGHVHQISARIAGVVQEVCVKDNQEVKKGDVLVKLDPADDQIEWDEASANKNKAQADFDRVQAVSQSQAISKRDLDAVQNALEIARARQNRARLQLDYTLVQAPAEGRIGRKNVEVGNRVVAGQTLMALVQSEMWVVANFKETQLREIQVGQKVKVTVDAIPGHSFEGVVDSFSPASGNQFALLPADNATGNFTKIVQRVGVKIVFKSESVQGYENALKPGLSAIVKIRIGDKK